MQITEEREAFTRLMRAFDALRREAQRPHPAQSIADLRTREKKLTALAKALAAWLSRATAPRVPGTGPLPFEFGRLIHDAEVMLRTAEDILARTERLLRSEQPPHTR